MAEAGAIVVIGAGGHARVVAEAAAACGMTLAGHIAPQADTTGMLGPHLGDDAAIPALAAKGHSFALGTGFVDAAGAARRAALLAGLPEALATVVHPAAIVSPTATLAPGAFVAAGAIVGTRCRIGRGAIVNTGAIVDHDSAVADNAHVATGARLAGAVLVGRNALIGAGATIRQGIGIGDDAIVGAGAVVIHPVPPGATVVGNPARPRANPKDQHP